MQQTNAENFSIWPYLINILDSCIAALYPTTVLQGLYRFPSPVPANANWVIHMYKEKFYQCN
jgi:hypothetical protein